MNLNDLYTAAQKAPDSEYTEDDPLTHEDAPDGTKVQAEIVYAGTKVSDKGKTRIIVKLEVRHPEPLKGKSFWNNISFSELKTAGGARFNKQQFAKLESAGITSQFLSQNPSLEAISKVLAGHTVDAQMKWEEDAKGRMWTSTFMPWYPVDNSPAGYVPGVVPQGF